MGCSSSEEPIKTLEPMEPIKTLEPMELMFLKHLEQMYIEELMRKREESYLIKSFSNNLEEEQLNYALPKSVKNILDEESEPKLEEEGIVESVNNKLNEESEPKLEGIVESVNNKLNEESEIKGAVKGVNNKNSDEEVNCFC